MIKNHSFFLYPQKPKQSQLSSHFDFGVNTSALFHLQYHDWGETLEQGTKPPTVPRAQQQYGCPLLRVCVYGVCVCVCVCVHCCVCALGWVKSRAQIPSMGHHTWPHVTSLHLCKSCFLNEGIFKTGFVKKLKPKDGSVPIVHDPAAPPEEVSLTFHFLWLFANRVCSSTEARGGVSRAH